MTGYMVIEAIRTSDKKFAIECPVATLKINCCNSQNHYLHYKKYISIALSSDSMIEIIRRNMTLLHKVAH